MVRRKSKLSMDQRAALPLSQDNPHITYLRVNRREICQRELDAAVRLFLIDEDPISSHLLASAANEIMTALSKGKPGVGLNDLRAMLKDAGISNDQSDELFQSLQHPYNFLKHSSSDFDVENEFSLDYIVMTVYNAIHSYKVLFGKLTPEMKVFYLIVQCWRINWWQGQPNSEDMQRIAANLDISGESFEEICSRGRVLLQKAWQQVPSG